MIRTHTKHVIGILVAGLLLLAGAWSAVFAQQQVSLELSPTTFERTANPGDTIEESFRITNRTDQDLNLTATPKNFTASGEEGAVDLTEDDTSYSLARWITVSPQTVTLPARGSQFFDITINVPENAEPGSKLGSVIVSTEGVAIDASGAAVSQEIGPLILLTVAGDIVEEANIVDFKASKSFWENGPITFETRVENSGNVHFKPSGTIVIKDTFGNEVTTLNLTENNVLPGTIRKLINEWAPGFSVGRYTADLSIVYGDNSQIDTASTTFIIFPYRIIIPAFIGAIILTIVLVRSRKRLQAAARALAGK